jgi:hypothetical protein
MKWKLDEALLNEMAREAMLEAEHEAEHVVKLCELAEMQMHTLIAMRKAGGTAHQVSAVLRYAIAMFQCSSEQEALALGDELRRMDDRA